jgi:hypothetical protein
MTGLSNNQEPVKGSNHQSEAEKNVSEPEQKVSKSDPQLTELDGLKKGGVEPTVNPEDKARDGDGKRE